MNKNLSNSFCRATYSRGHVRVTVFIDWAKDHFKSSLSNQEMEFILQHSKGYNNLMVDEQESLNPKSLTINRNNVMSDLSDMQVDDFSDDEFINGGISNTWRGSYNNNQRNTGNKK